MPYLYLLLRAEPLLPNITANDCYVVPLVSRTEVRLFYTFVRYRDVGWDKRERDSGYKWVTASFGIKDVKASSDVVAAVAERLWSFVREQLEQRFGVPDMPAVENEMSRANNGDGSVSS
jgi:hypothetical protein